MTQKEKKKLLDTVLQTHVDRFAEILNTGTKAEVEALYKYAQEKASNLEVNGSERVTWGGVASLLFRQVKRF